MFGVNGLSVQKKFKIGFQDSGHLEFSIKTMFTVLKESQLGSIPVTFN